MKVPWRNEFEITDAIQVLVNTGAKVNVQFVQGWWKDTGRPEDLLESNQLILHDLEPFNQGIVEEGAHLTSRVGIGNDTLVHKSSTIRGPAIMGRNCEIGPNAYVGPYTSLGDNVKLRNSEIENSIVMEGAHIDCGKRIIDSIIGRNAKIVDSNSNLPRGYKLILGDMTYVSI